MAAEGPTQQSAAAQHALARFGLGGRTALVTGGTRGIGNCVTKELAKLGCKVYVCGRNAEDLAARLGEWQAAGLDVQGSTCDVSDRAQRTELAERVSGAFGGRLHILVNNVGTNVRKPTVEYTEEEYSFVMRTNLESAYHLCQVLQPLLKASGDGCIVFNSSVAGGPTAMRSGTLYAMTKAAINQLTKNLACEWAGAGIRVNTVAPWYTATDLALQVLKDESFKAEVLSRTPMKRIGEPEEVAGAVAYLCSPAAAYVTGQVLRIDGGYSVMGFY
ncbi:hypothetical protein HYH03_000170 [Edaphochlamys debaryana]|uniref:Tropinone reductase n=1 Tax=Edaphochlamys debaryana TaxID=47281 RepID=A0A835YH17_9CHLO|nr:hypothetical protein HYH03_000170 [Edaphochlamys debaryana]|eukprot:KAG2501667.1 hypothetical protein HYH03_000170 [Edaphochlamys debaryana]